MLWARLIHSRYRELVIRSEEHTSELQSQSNLVCRLLLEKKIDPAPPRNTPEAQGGLKGLARSAKDEAEAEAIAKALDETNWNRKQAAVLLQISYKALLYKIRQYGIAQQNKNAHKLSAGA